MSAFTTLIIGLATVLIAWFARTVFLKRKLYLIQPKLFDYSGLGSNASSKTLEITAINGGRRAEEDIRIEFAPGFNYTVIASGSAGLNITDEGILRIERLAPKQEVTLILVAEGGEFRKEHVLGISSKDCVGKIKSSLQEAQASPEQNLIAFAVLFFLLFPIGYALGKLIELVVWPDLLAPALLEKEMVSFEVIEGELSWTKSSPETFAKSVASTLEFQSVRRRGDTIFLTVRVENKLEKRLSYTISSSTAVSDERPFPMSDYIQADVVVFPKAIKVIELEEYLPITVNPQVIVVETRAEDGDVTTVWKTFDLQLKN